MRVLLDENVPVQLKGALPKHAVKSVNDKDVMVYIGPYNSGAAAVSMPILNKAGITMISPAAFHSSRG